MDSIVEGSISFTEAPPLVIIASLKPLLPVTVMGTFLMSFTKASLCSLVIFAELGLLALILLEIRKTGKPFSKKIITKLRLMAVILLAGGLIPSCSTIPVDDSQFAVTISFDMQNILIIGIGVIIGILSEVFVYGLSLQEDNDSIA